INSIKSLIGKDYIELAEKIINRKELSTNKKFSHHIKELLIIRFSISLKRLLGGAKLEKQLYTLNMKTDSIQTTIYSLKITEDILKITLSEIDIIYFHQLFNCEEDINEFIMQTDPSIVEEMTSNLLINIKEYLEIDLSDDFEFINGLKIHLFTLLNNTKDFRKYNTLTDKVKYKYPYIVEILRRILKNNGILSYNNIDDEDISFISLYIGTAIESKKGENLIPRALLITENSYSLSYILKTKIDIYIPDII
ncbi:PRD domain-containing protein, partial [Vibrio parahaemolyticus]|nr:PRD domain-containing protein [Vibrio parahaemolyticus]NMR96754.1 PRD domain-containing protein [Vibrio parahaemolyticus]